MDDTTNVISFPEPHPVASSSDLLDQLMDRVRTASPPPSGQAIARINYSHDGMIDLIIADPGISQNEIAAHFHYSAAWVSRVMSSDAFQARMAERTAQLVDPTLRLTVEQRFKALMLRSLEIIMEKLEGPTAQVPAQLAIKALEVSARCAGYGAREPVQVQPQTIHNHLTLLSENLVGLLKTKKVEAGFIDSTAEIVNHA